MARFRSIPKFLEAVQIVSVDGPRGPVNFSEDAPWLQKAVQMGVESRELAPSTVGCIYIRDGNLWVVSPAGPNWGHPGDWICCLSANEIYVIKGDVMPTLYEPAP